MSARAWHRRNEGKRFRMELKHAFAALRVDPESTYYLEEWGLVAISPEKYERLTNAPG